MDSFVRQLTSRLLDPANPMSRNKHFHTFTTDEGKEALKLAKRLRAFERDLLNAIDRKAQVTWFQNADGSQQLEILQQAINSKRSTRLTIEEFELLEQLPKAAAALRQIGRTKTKGNSD